MSIELGVFSGALRAWQPEQIALAAAAAGLETLEWEVGAADRAHISLGAFERDADDCAQASERAGLSIAGVCGDVGLSILSPQDVGSLVKACAAVGATEARLFAPAPTRDMSISSQLGALREALRGYEDVLQANGITLLIELSQETLVPSPELFLHVCDGLSPSLYGILTTPRTWSRKDTSSPPSRSISWASTSSACT